MADEEFVFSKYHQDRPGAPKPGKFTDAKNFRLQLENVFDAMLLVCSIPKEIELSNRLSTHADPCGT